MTLTEKGREEWKEVVGLVFEYLREMKKEGVKEWVWEEMKDVEGVQFEEKEKAEGKKYVGRLCENMQVWFIVFYLFICLLFSQNLIIQNEIGL